MDLFRTLAAGALRAAAFKLTRPRPVSGGWVLAWIVADCIAAVGLLKLLFDEHNRAVANDLGTCAALDALEKEAKDLRADIAHKAGVNALATDRLRTDFDRYRRYLGDESGCGFEGAIDRLTSANAAHRLVLDALVSDVTALRVAVRAARVDLGDVEAIRAAEGCALGSCGASAQDTGLDSQLDAWPPFDGERFDAFSNRAGGACAGWRIQPDRVWDLKRVRWVLA